MAKHYVLAMLCIMVQIMFNPAWAEVTSPTTVTSTTSQDAIQTFVKSDFATRRAMLNHGQPVLSNSISWWHILIKMSYILIAQAILIF